MVRGITTPRLASCLLFVAAAGALSPVDAAPRSGVNCRPLESRLEMMQELCVCQPCHLCEFSLTEGKCTLIPHPDMDLSDGSDVEIEQPFLEPTDWFLTKEEIARSRGGVPRDDLSVFTKGNQVTAFVASNEYFQSVYDDIESAGAGHRIFLTGWSVDEVPFKPQEDRTGKMTSFGMVFGKAIARGANFHALVWSNLLETEQNVQMRDYLHNLPHTEGAGKAHFMFDDRLVAAISSHHQKSVIIERDHDLVAYVGGVDLTSDRWDTIHHDQDVLRTEAGIQRIYNGWVDAHVRIVGPATKDVAANFLARWNSKTKASQDLLDDLMDFENPEHSELPVGLCGVDPEVDAAHTGPHNVQIARTFSCEYKNYEFAPKGERSIFEARIKAIRNAKNYIYIEDQYFVLVPQLLEELLKVLPRLQRIIVVVPRPDSSATLAGYEKFMFDNVEPIQKMYPNKFQFYTTKKSRSIYVHTKLVIIDDVYVTVGSANWNRRSMTSDSEIAANIIDDEHVQSPDGITVNKLARDFRIRKFVEKTGRTYEELDAMTFLEAADTLDLAAEEESTLIEPMELDEKFYFAAYSSESVREFVDAEDICIEPIEPVEPVEPIEPAKDEL
jgi:phosphatidylserine/phosphatidylglycerophosphate/cardiolipin synthase-like enzyme